ncbi:MAG: hypothetical protein EPO21_17210 [Chloroflexota bacterium]|nr:MAG: hypothetical protein EPO21_17210 [Chloroflexota bacterium]
MPSISERLFTDEELRQMETETVDLLEQAIDDKDLDRAKKLARRMHREFFAMHETYRDWVASLLSFIETRLGDDAVYDALHDSLQDMVNLAETYRRQDLRRRVQMLAAGFRGHLAPLHIEEGEDKITVAMTPCGSGGRAILNKSYDPPKGFVKIEKAHRMTFGKNDFPVYCTHCALQDIIPMEATGYPVWVIDPAEKMGEEPCRYHIYKDPDSIPAAYYERFGLKKPSPRTGTR